MLHIEKSFAPFIPSKKVTFTSNVMKLNANPNMHPLNRLNNSILHSNNIQNNSDYRKFLSKQKS